MFVMKWRAAGIIAIVAFIALAAWMKSHGSDKVSARREINPPVTNSSPAPVADNPVSTGKTPPAEAPPITPPPRSEPSRAASRRDLANPLVDSDTPGVSSKASPNIDTASETDLDKITLMFRDYRTITGENPVGTNAEIMKSIMGGNPKGAMLGPPEGQSVNENGELLDRWGTPYFFHQLTRDLTEIHSAGPDRKMWTADDIVSK